jgi:predicted dehydrogenase
MPKSLSIKTCLIGFGNVGQGLYLKTVTRNSHLRSILANENFDLVAVVDPYVSNIAINMPEVRFTKSIQEVQDMSVDLAVIASPTSTHLETCLHLINQLKPNAVLIEKPVGLTLVECKKIMKCLQETPTVFVNYQRNYNQKIVKQVTDLISFGYSKGVIYYSNGAINNASHGLAILILILGTPTSVFRSSRGIKESLSDLNFDFVVEFGETRIFFISTEEEDYSMFRIELFGPKGSWLYDSGLERSEMRARVEDPIYVGRFSLTENSTITSIPDSESFTHVYEYLEKRIRRDSEIEPNLGASLDLAYEVHQVIEKAQK